MRVLITGLSSYWGGRLAQVLERDDDVETIIGVSTEDPTCELHRTEYVRVGTQHALLRRIVHAAEIDTVVDTRLIVDSATAPPRVAHEQNVIGTMNILTACGGPNSPVKKVVFKSSAHYYGCERDDPSFFTETMRRPHEPRTRLESDIVEADDAVQGFAERNPDVTVTTLRFCNGLGPDLQTQPQRAAEPARGPRHPRLRPALPVHPRGRHRRRAPPRASNDLPGIYNAAPDGVLALSRGREPARQAVRADAAALGHRARGQSATGRSASGSRTRSSSNCDTAAVSTTARSSSPATASASRRARRCRHSPRRCGSRRCARTARRHIATSAKWRNSCAGRRACAAMSQPPDPKATLAALPVAPRGLLPSPDRMRTRLIVLATVLVLLGLGGVAGVYFYDQGKQDLIAEGREGQRRPDRRDDARPGGAEAVRRRCWRRSTARSRSATRTARSRSPRRRRRSGSTSAARSTRRCGARRRATCSPARGATCATSR